MKRILVRTPQWLGDAVVSTVFLSRIKARHADAHLTVLCPAALQALFETHPAVDQVLPFDYRKGDSVFGVAARVKAAAPDEMYVLPRSFRTAFEAWLSRAPRRVGFGGDARRWFFTETARYDRRLSYPHRYLALLGEETLAPDLMVPHFPSAPFERPVKGPVLGLAPVSIAPSRTWDAGRFAEVATRFIERTGGSALLFGSSAERAAVERVASRIRGPVINTAGELTLPQLGGALKSLAALIANDSGLMHAASVFGTPTVVVFGASDPGPAVPLWGRVAPVHHPEIDCVPCGRNHCVRFGNERNACLNAATVDQVDRALSNLLAR